MSLPQRRYVAINAEDQSLSIARDDCPAPGPGELLIKVAAAGLNRADLLQRQGLYPPPADASPIMGLEVAGTVIAMGADVSGWQTGDAVCALTHGGGYADHAVAPASQALPISDSIGVEQAAALPEALLTMWHNVFQRAGMHAGDKVLIHGGASGMGTLGIQMASALGGEVYTTAGTADKCKALEALGATRAINYRDEDFEQVLSEMGLRDAIDIILDMVGGDFIQKNINVAAPEGRIVNIAFIRGFQAEINFVPLLLKRITLSGSTLRAQSFEQKAVMTREIREHIYPHLESGAIKPVIDRVFELEDVEQAHDYMQSGAHMGKILLRP
ncbi:NAD(P)H-quinone oxidoreductase [Pseudohalioglobus sediminis]|uniref:NAD(P)H-quinone oxidoreductase n=1 Tax=Pseudohalioglobus sediminis TaxID=2606449 RepID=A0A5B0WUT3_9GAMM|nr:NAD(P)H-quinone oxidoreductase [Pseudohalioglobus sediminis]KAA1189639.1 NAD(P)H-quinone oxidoreductase [Pseudohalioglobus sediminis]